MEDYLITIVIPMYNVESSIERLIISISEAFKDQESLVEVLAIDDGSTDKTVEIFKNLHGKSQLLALKLIQNSHGGESKARNTGIKGSLSKRTDAKILIIIFKLLDGSLIVFLF